MPANHRKEQMLGFKRIVITDHERGIHFKEGSLKQILGAGIYRFWDPLNRQKIVNYPLSQTAFNSPQLDIWLQQKSDLFAEHFHIVETDADSIALIYKNKHLQALLPPDSRCVYWREAFDIDVKTINISADFTVEKTTLEHLLLVKDRPEFAKLTQDLHVVEVPEQHQGLLFVDGKLQAPLPAGVHGFWSYQHTIAVELVDLRMQNMDVQGQEILSKDKVSLRINLSANYRITDALKARRELGDYEGYLYRGLQFALRQVVATRSLDDLLADKVALDKQVFKGISDEITAFGIEVVSVGMKDVILPGDMKDLLNQVVEAEKVAQANVIRRREETAATRSLLNTAKLMDSNPTLLRLKELESLEKLTDNIGNLTVYGGLDGVLENLVRIKAA